MIPCHIFLFVLFKCSKRHVRLQFGSICTNTLPNQVHFFANHTHLPWLCFFAWLRSNVDVTPVLSLFIAKQTELGYVEDNEAFQGEMQGVWHAPCIQTAR